MAKSKKAPTASRAPTDVDRVVGENLRRLRTARSKTLSELAGELGISHQQLQKYETASNRLSAGMLDRAARVLGVPIAELFQRRPEETQAKSRDSKVGRMDALQEEGNWLLGKAGSETTLLQMVEVLRVLARRA